MGKVKVAIIGAGLRGTYKYGEYIQKNLSLCEVVAIVEPKKGRRDIFVNKYNINKDNAFDNFEDFFEKGKIADAVIICNSDARHYDYLNKSLEIGYHVLLENPMTNSLDKLVHIKELANKFNDRVFMSCNELRYTKFFNKLKEIIQSQELGKLVNIQYKDNIGHWNYAHNYIRGNWRNSSDSSPIIVSRNCNDIDILIYLIESNCKKISSFGRLKHLNNENMNLNMSESCLRCSIENKCPYSAKKIYLEKDRTIKYSVHIDPSESNLKEILEKGPYGRCVYMCDNNVCDNMVSILEFENGVNVTLNSSAFTKEPNKLINMMFSFGEVSGNFIDGKIRIEKFSQENFIEININEDIKDEMLNTKLISDFIGLINKQINKNTILDNIQSHIVSFAGEYSRVSSEVVTIDKFFDNAVEMTKQIESVLI